MKKRVGFKQKAKSFVKKLLLATALLHVGTQVYHSGNNLVNKLNPSEVREQFQRETGFPIEGYTSDIEDSLHTIEVYQEVIQEEKKTRDFKISRLQIENASYLRGNIPEQINDLASTGYTGLYNPLTDVITLMNASKRNVLHHEIKHAKAYEIEEEHPGFLAKWAEISRDKNGNSQYLPIRAQVCSRIRGLEHLVKKEKRTEEENFREGFVSDYARTNVHEDIAEFGEKIEDDLRVRASALGKELKDPANAKLVRKLELAIEYGLVPKETLQLIKLEETFGQNYPYVFNQPDFSREGGYLEMSRAFLDENPNSVFAQGIRGKRAEVLYHRSLGSKATDKESIDAMREYRDIIFATGASPLETRYRAYNAMEKLEVIAGYSLKNPELAKAYNTVFKNTSWGNATPKEIRENLIAQGISPTTGLFSK